MAHHIYIIDYVQDGNLYTKAVYGKVLDNNQIVYNTEIFLNHKILFKICDTTTITYKTITLYYDYGINYNHINIPKYIEQYYKKQKKYKTITKNNIKPGDLLYIDNGKSKKVVKLLKTIRYTFSKMEFYKFYVLNTQKIQEILVSVIDGVMEGNYDYYPNAICVKLNDENKLKYL